MTIKKKKSSSISYSLVIPLFNNAATAKPLLTKSLKQLEKSHSPYEVILCNDGSSDTTADILSKFQKKHSHVRLINHQSNQGIASTLQDLYTHAKGTYTLLFSVDGGWEPHDITALIQAQQQTHADIIIGKRQHKQYTLPRHFISFFYNFLPMLLFGTKTYDAGSIKVFKTEIFSHTTFQASSVFFESEMLIKAQRRGYTITTIPVSHYQKAVTTKSGVNTKAVLSAFLDIIKLRLTYHE